MQVLAQVLPTNNDLARENPALFDPNVALADILINSPRKFWLPANNLVARNPNPPNPPIPQNPPAPIIQNIVAENVMVPENVRHRPIYAPQIRFLRPRACRPPSKIQRNRRRAGNWVREPQQPPQQIALQLMVRQPDHINFGRGFRCLHPG